MCKLWKINNMIIVSDTKKKKNYIIQLACGSPGVTTWSVKVVEFLFPDLQVYLPESVLVTLANVNRLAKKFDDLSVSTLKLPLRSWKVTILTLSHINKLIQVYYKSENMRDVWIIKGWNTSVSGIVKIVLNCIRKNKTYN